MKKAVISRGVRVEVETEHDGLPYLHVVSCSVPLTPHLMEFLTESFDEALAEMTKP